MLKFLKKLLNLLTFGRHGEPNANAPAASSPRASGRSVVGTGPFPTEIVQGAVDAAGMYPGTFIWPSVTLAQWALESNYGKSMPDGSNNPFGIKAVGDQAYVTAMTWEVIKGKSVKMTQRFAKYPSMAHAFAAHNKLLATSKHYKKARAAKTAVEFAKALTGVYATDPDYDKKLRSIMGKHNLYQYDA